MQTLNPIEQFFQNLDKWRNLPSYQLERRADVLFSIYLPGFLQTRFERIPEMIIPEFPVHIETIYPKIKINRLFKIDYLITFSDKYVVFVELKTEMGSRNEKQGKYLQRANEVGIPALTKGILKIYSKTQSKAKYDHLLQLLIKAGFLDSNRSVINDKFETSILYLQPRHSASDHQIVTFTEFADYVSKYSDQVSQRFAESLKLWGSVQAG